MTLAPQALPVIPLAQRPTNQQEYAMPTAPFETETITTRRHIWRVSVPPEGTTLNAIETTVAAAAVAAKQAWGIDDNTQIPGDALTFTIGSGQIVVSFVTEDRQP